MDDVPSKLKELTSQQTMLQSKHTYLLELQEDTVVRLSELSREYETDRETARDETAQLNRSLKTAAEQLNQQKNNQVIRTNLRTN
jgi:phospholipase/lecithinase/hemolysin